MQLNNPEERSPVLHRGKNLKSRKLLIIVVMFIEIIFMVMRQVDLYLKLRTSKYFMTQGHIRYCGLVHGAHVEK